MRHPLRAQGFQSIHICFFALASIFIVVSVLQAESRTDQVIRLKGWVSDANCGVQHAKIGGKECVKKCLKGGAHVGHPEWAPQSMIFIQEENQKIWELENPDLLKGYEGEIVLISAVPNQEKGSLKIASIIPFRQPTTTQLFTFRNGFWINLHHFMRGEARRILHPETMPEVQFKPSLNEAEVEAWNVSLEYYKAHFAEKDLVFDKELWKVKNALSDAGNSEVIKIDDPEFMAVLTKAAPIYKKHWWGIHKESNDSWISTASRLVAQFGPGIADRLTNAYSATWPKTPVPVDVTIEAGWAGAYTTENPVHITISSSETRIQDYAALEMLFHEASHAWDASLAEKIKTIANQNQMEPPPDLWHALIFYTSGELTRSELAKVQIPNYVPYAYKNKNYERHWQEYECALKLHWQPVLENPSSANSALERVVQNSTNCRSQGQESSH